MKIKNKQKTVSFYTLGCRLNQSETAVIENTFDSEYKSVLLKDGADMVIINTCTVTENGDNDTRRLINRAIRYNANVKIALIGCQAQVQKEKLAKLPNVKWIVGNAKKMDIATIIKEDKLETTQVITPTITRNSFTIPTPGIDNKHTRANIKIQDGCDFFCSFCEIPYARGRARSRVFKDILKESSALVDAGHKEIVLTGINLGMYKYKKYELLDVISALEDIEGLERIRISSIEPTTISFSLVQKMTKSSKLCRHLHIPIQSGSNKILKDMNRKYSFEEFSEFILKVAEINSDICIGTDVIVGYPGETDKEFCETEERLRDLPLHYFHVFSYSKRYMARSRTANNEISKQVIKERSFRLRSLSQRKRDLFYQSYLNTKQEMIVEQKKDDLWVGVSDNYIRMACKSDDDLRNKNCKSTTEQ